MFHNYLEEKAIENLFKIVHQVNLQIFFSIYVILDVQMDILQMNKLGNVLKYALNLNLEMIVQIIVLIHVHSHNFISEIQIQKNVYVWINVLKELLPIQITIVNADLIVYLHFLLKIRQTVASNIV